MTSTYILIDTTLIGDQNKKPWIKKHRKPSWVAALYVRPAIDVSPILIDIERSIVCNRLDSVMELVNSSFPQLGISFIETELTLAQLQAHLRQFIFILAEDGTELTLRFADCVVLPALSKCLTGEQWSCLVAPFLSWKIHGRDGNLHSLPILKADNALKLPLTVGNEQLASLKDAMAADQLLANLRRLRPGHSSIYSTPKAHACAQRTRDIWVAAGHDEDKDLLLFARDVFATNGQLLYLPVLKEVLAQPDPICRRTDLTRLTNLYLSKVEI